MSHNKKNKTIFLVVQQGFGARYLLRTDILKKLKELGCRLIILSPNAHEPYFRKEFESEDVFIEPFRDKECNDYLKKSKGQKFFRLVRSFVLSGKGNLKSVDDHYSIFLKENSKSFLKIFITGLFVKILKNSRFARKLFLKIENFLFAPDIHGDIFRKYEPDLIVTSSLGNVGDGFDFFIMREARKHKVSVATIILSWDNTSSKGMGGASPDSLIVWTEIMKKELIDYHDIPENKIFIGGIAHFDVYSHRQWHLSKEETFKKFGLDPNRKLILFGTKSPVSYPWNADIIEIIGRAIDSGAIHLPSQLLVRLHPIHFGRRNKILRHEASLKEYEQLKDKFQHVHFNYPTILSEVLSFDMPEHEMVELASILSHTDVMVNMFSTLTLEACLVGVPTINICFEGPSEKKKNARQSIQIDLDQVHNQRIIRTNGVKLSYNPAELITYVNEYLHSHAIDEEKRKTIVQSECGPNLGTSGEKIARHLFSLKTVENK